MGQVTRDEVIIYLGCVTNAQSWTVRGSTTTQTSYELHPIVLPRPSEGRELHTVKCGRCGKDVELNVQSEASWKTQFLVAGVAAMVVGIVIMIVASTTRLQGLGCIGLPLFGFGAYMGYTALFGKKTPTDVVGLHEETHGHKLYNDPPARPF